MTNKSPAKVVDITGNTRVLLTLAHPVAHLRSPAMMSELFSAGGRDAVMLAADVKPEALAGLVAGLRYMDNLDGFCVTIPHKQAILPLLDRLTPAAEEAQAVNIVRRDADGTLVGHQVDGEGMVRALRDAGHQIAGRRVFLAGAGGAATGIAFAVAHAGAARLCIVNRTPAKAEALAARVRAEVPGCDIITGDSPGSYDILINGTSAGLSGAATLPFALDGVGAGAVVAEVVMTPRETPLLKAAMERGLRGQFGEDMLRAQLSLMEEFWGPSRANQAQTVNDQ
jgi:shikimate dehydrogenase